MVRLAFAVPFVVIALASAAPAVTAATVNASSVARVAGVPWDRADAAWVGDLYPPLGTVLVRLIPGGSFGLGIAGALVAGLLLQQLLEVMVHRRFRWWTILVFLTAVAGNPLFAYTATGNFEAFLSIALFGVGTVNMVRFITGRNTKAGFESGILFMLSALADASGLILVVVVAVTAPLLVVARRGQAGARSSNVLIVLFPTIAVFLSVMFLQLVFLDDPFAVFRSVVHYDPARWAIVPYLFTTADGLLLVAPVASGAALALLARRPGSILIGVFVFAALIFGFIGGLVATNSAGNVYLVMSMMAIAILPAARTVRTSAWITAVGGFQIVIAWASAGNRPATLEWMGAIARSIGWS
ncbi:hypothetical protein [Curtobacterium sp. VKM Ac-1393]|uniref:hypothetical protein n=1 Tax=Curtobacterium sp. VKM Ac-1393 TaxID=2783814 RepID=UPI001E55CE56|nr:hypothetical protein [Curtobacterium sp. VKM Ac-1393]